MLHSILRYIFVVYFSVIIFVNTTVKSQPEQQSHHGYILPVKGHIHLLIIFAEVIYDTGTDPCPPEGTDGWKAGQLPTWKDDLIDPFPSHAPKGKLTRFFHEMSFGSYIVTGDYLLNPDNTSKPFQLKSSENVNVANIYSKVSESKEFLTRNRFSHQDFDKWTLTHVGHQKITPSIDEPLRYDHVMIVIRNSNYPFNFSGWTSSGSPGRIFGYQSDSYSFFCTHNALPFNIMLHEYAHMLFGGNNFHAGGSHSKKAGHSYFMPIQGGWGMMGAAGKSLLTANAWERRRLGWKRNDKEFYISCLNEIGQEVETDLDAERSEQQGVYLIRDFVTSGDAIRIRLPHLSENVFPQWLWIENHQTYSFNKSIFDRFQYEYADCVDNARPGLYMYMQVDKEDMTGKTMFGGYADYLRPLPANGMYDIIMDTEKVQNPWCINNNFYYPHTLHHKFENPLSGNHELETIPRDMNDDGIISIDEHLPPSARRENGEVIFQLPNLGTKETVFSLKKNKKIGIGTNPSTASMITNVSAVSELFGKNPPNNRTVYLNGISIEILDRVSPIEGGIFVRIRFDDYEIRQNIRWCADTIMLISKREEVNMYVDNKKILLIDRGLTPTRINKTAVFNNQNIFSEPTVFVIGNNTTLQLGKRAKLIIDNGSECIIQPEANIIMGKGARIIVRNNSKFKIMNDNSIIRARRSQILYK